jgi:hypothetical protein
MGVDLFKHLPVDAVGERDRSSSKLKKSTTEILLDAHPNSRRKFTKTEPDASVV